MSRLAIGASLAVLALALALAARPAPETAAGRVDHVASELRCPVCQGLSVRDSPSETAREMRDLVALRVAEGKSDDAIRDEFRAAYGDWIVLRPPLLSPAGLVWLAPLLLVAGGAALALRLARAPASAPAGPPDQAALAALRERVARDEEADA